MIKLQITKSKTHENAEPCLRRCSESAELRNIEKFNINCINPNHFDREL